MHTPPPFHKPLLMQRSVGVILSCAWESWGSLQNQLGHLLKVTELVSDGAKTQSHFILIL